MYVVGIFDRDARRSGPTIHYVGFKTLVQNLLEILGNLSFTLGHLKRSHGGHLEANWKPKFALGILQNFSEWSSN